MNYEEAVEFVNTKFIPLIHDRMKEVYPDMYDTCTKTKKHKFDNNPYPYRLYIEFINNVLSSETEKYHSELGDYSYLLRMYDDFKSVERDKVLEWLVYYIKIR